MPCAIIVFDFDICTISHDNVRFPPSISFVQQLRAAQTFCLSLVLVAVFSKVSLFVYFDPEFHTKAMQHIDINS